MRRDMTRSQTDVVYRAAGDMFGPRVFECHITQNVRYQRSDNQILRIKYHRKPHANSMKKWRMLQNLPHKNM